MPSRTHLQAIRDALNDIPPAETPGYPKAHVSHVCTGRKWNARCVAEPWPAEPSADCAGAGLYSSVPDFMRLLADLIRDEPTILKRETVERYMFAPQFTADPEPRVAMSQSMGMISALTGTDPKNSTAGMNWGLGGVFFTKAAGHIEAGTLYWGGLPNVLWSASRRRGSRRFSRRSFYPTMMLNV
jgi:CubicO group peptidase (beta-lactamase class C family)